MLLSTAFVSRLPVVASTRWVAPPTARLTILSGTPDPLTSLLDEVVPLIDLSIYPFMFPTCVLVAFLANSSGIGGAALFGPIFLIVFPALGSQYPLASPAAAVGVAILVESFGFSSGVTGYFRRGLIDLRAAAQWAAVAMPAALIASKYLALPVLALKALYSALMLLLGAYLLREAALSDAAGPTAADATLRVHANPNDADADGLTTLTEASGKIYTYPTPSIDFSGGLISAVGGVLCGLLGVGIGEVVLPQMLRRQVTFHPLRCTSDETLLPGEPFHPTMFIPTAGACPRGGSDVHARRRTHLCGLCR